MVRFNRFSLKRHMVTALFVLVIFVVVGVLWFTDSWLGIGAKSFAPANAILFHPDEIQSVEWTSDGETVKLARSEKGSAWQEPADVDTARVQMMLVALAQANPEPSTFAPFTRVRASLKTFDGQRLRFTWNGAVFKWTDGPREDQGGKPFPLLRASLEEGRFVFARTRLGWCPQRPVEISVTGPVGEFTIRGDKSGSWEKTEGAAPAKKIDPTSVERWLGRMCDVDGTHWVDHDIAKAPSTDSRFAVKYADGSEAEWKIASETGAIKENGRSLIAPGFISALRELGKIP